jgi:predicted phage gp36 major capsid-like protein
MGLMDKIKTAAQDVAAEAKKATVQGKSKLDQMQLRKKADEAAKQLGYLVHAERAKGTPAGPEADRLVADMTQLETEIAEAEAEAQAQAAPAPAGPAQPAEPAAPTPPPPSSEPSSGDFKL